MSYQDLKSVKSSQPLLPPSHEDGFINFDAISSLD